MTKIFEVMPKRTKCSDGIGLTPEMVVVGEYYIPLDDGDLEVKKSYTLILFRQ